MKQPFIFLFVMLLLLSCTHKVQKEKTVKEVVPDINGAWAFVEINGAKLTKEKAGKDLPYIEFNTSLNSLTGSTGCNRITGKAVVMESAVDFVNLASTRMFCQNAIYETPILQLLRGSLSYKLENGQLIFTKEGKRILVLQK